MRLMAIGDYYVWYCDWCDTRNLTLWQKVTKNQVCCAACHKKFSVDGQEFLPSGISVAHHPVLPLC